MEAKQCPLKMAAAVTHKGFDDIYRLKAEGDCLCDGVECAWWSSYAEQCAIVYIPGAIHDATLDLVGAINRK